MRFIQRSTQNHIEIITINRPPLNALNSELLEELSETFSSIAADETIRACVLTGEGRAFVAGADIAEMKDFSRDEAYIYAKRGHRAFSRIENAPQIVIAAINGYALGGGCEIALACDIRIASSKAKFAQPEVGLCITPGFGGTQRLTRAVGYAAAIQLIAMGQTIDADEAYRLGLVSEITTPEELMPLALRMAETIAKNSPGAVRAAKEAMRAGLEKPLPDGLLIEAEHFADCFPSGDPQKAMRDFLGEK